MIQILVSEFREVELIWRDKLWPGRSSAIEATSAINHDGNIDLEIMKSEAVFFKAIHENNIVGVISAFKTDDSKMRSRGLWVSPEFRKLSYGRALLDKVAEYSIDQNCPTIWTMPRLAAEAFYVKCGFKTYNYTNKFEFGPHCLAERIIRT